MENKEFDDELKTYTLKEIEALYTVSRRSLLRYVQKGSLKAVRVGRVYRITAANLKKFLAGKQ